MSSEKTPEAIADIERSAENSTHDTHGTGIVEEMAISEPTNKLQRWANKLDELAGLEARGIERISEEVRAKKMTVRDYISMFTM